MPPVADGVDRGLFAFEQLLDHEGAAEGTRGPETRVELGLRPADEDPFARGQAVCLDDARRTGNRERLGRRHPGGVRHHHDPAGRGASDAIKLGMDALVVEHLLADDARREALDDRGDAGRAEPLVKLAPADDAAVGRQLQEVVVAPAGIAAQHLEPGHLHRRFS